MLELNKNETTFKLQATECFGYSLAISGQKMFYTLVYNEDSLCLSQDNPFSLDHSQKNTAFYMFKEEKGKGSNVTKLIEVKLESQEARHTIEIFHRLSSYLA